jgi:acyl-CoA dehydrogenase
VSWEFETDPQLEATLGWARRFMREEIYPLEVLAPELPEERFRVHLSSLQEQVKRAGLWALHLPPELGGHGYGQVQLALLNEVIGASIWWGPIVFGCQAPDSGNAEILARFGTEEQKRDWLEPLIAGRIRSAFSMTEPGNAGSDPAVLTTHAELDGDEWVLTGEKWFTSNGMIADVLIVMAVTDPGADRHARASMLIVPADTPGVERLRNIPSLEVDPGFGYGHAEIRYREARVPVANLLGERGRGFAIAQSRLGPGRIHHCMRWLGQSHRAFAILCERALQRVVTGEPLAGKQTVRTWIADSEAEIQAARLLTLQAAWKIDTQGVAAARKEISLIKFWGARVMHNVIDRAIQVCGSLGYSADLPLQEMYRFARAARIYDGADEVHREAVARAVLRERMAPLGPYPSDHLPSRRRAALARMGKADRTGVEAVH